MTVPWAHRLSKCARRKAKTTRARTSRRALLLFDYQSWLTLTAGVAHAAAAAEASGASRR